MTTPGGCALILDDEALVAMLLADFLDALDWTDVESAVSVEEAMAVLDHRSVRFAILDCNLGGAARSWAVADRLEDDGVPFLFSSGLSRDQLPPRHADRPMLAKPYTLASLSAAIAELNL